MKQKIAFAMIMGVVTTGIISFTLISVNIGFNERFFTIWLRSWSLAYLVAIPAILLIAPQIEKLVRWLFPVEKRSSDAEEIFFTNEETEEA